ncbi:MAG: hypothetical protein HFJ06_16820 [Lachnospiraceae bacterium]|nr:hypothetical protein [Lachnospiraceae bacterium]
MSETYKLPGSSYEEFVKIIKAYATGKIAIPMTLETVAQTAGMDKTIVSRNNGFLVQLSLISDGNKKSPTQEGLDLGRAYSLKMDEQVAKTWKTIIERDEFLSRMLSAIKIRNGMEKSSFINHILYSSGSSNNNNTRAGASTIVEIYKVAGLVEENDGKIIALDEESIDVNDYTDVVAKKEQNSETSQPVKSTQVYSDKKIIININIDAKVEDLDVLSDKLKNLIENINQ